MAEPGVAPGTSGYEPDEILFLHSAASIVAVAAETAGIGRHDDRDETLLTEIVCRKDDGHIPTTVSHDGLQHEFRLCKEVLASRSHAAGAAAGHNSYDRRRGSGRVLRDDPSGRRRDRRRRSAHCPLSVRISSGYCASVTALEDNRNDTPTALHGTGLGADGLRLERRLLDQIRVRGLGICSDGIERWAVSLPLGFDDGDALPVYVEYADSGGAGGWTLSDCGQTIPRVFVMRRTGRPTGEEIGFIARLAEASRFASYDEETQTVSAMLGSAPPSAWQVGAFAQLLAQIQGAVCWHGD